jgi:hypothetical protein
MGEHGSTRGNNHCHVQAGGHRRSGYIRAPPPAQVTKTRLRISVDAGDFPARVNSPVSWLRTIESRHDENLLRSTGDS